MLSRRRFLVSGLLGLVSVIAAACAAAVRSSFPSASSLLPSPTSPPPTPESASPSPSPVGPTLRERIGQMVVVGFRGLTPDEAEPVRALIADGTLGGVILFSVDQLTGGPRNVESPDQLRSLVAALSGAATAAPLLVAIDQEGGQVARLGPSHGFPATRSAADLGRGDPSETAAAAAEIAATLTDVGVTLNLAPVVDLAVNPDNPSIAAVDRSFSADPEVVIAHASAFIEALACGRGELRDQALPRAGQRRRRYPPRGRGRDRRLDRCRARTVPGPDRRRAPGCGPHRPHLQRQARSGPPGLAVRRRRSTACCGAISGSIGP